MTQYIDKAALVAEIKRLIEIANNNYAKYLGNRSAWAHQRVVCEKLLSFLNTLEVKDDVVSNDTLSNSLEISRHGNSRNGETLEEAAKNHKSAIHIVSSQWTSEVEKAFKAGAEWQKKQTIDKACEWLEEHLLNFWSQKIINMDYFIEGFKKSMEK